MVTAIGEVKIFEQNTDNSISIERWKETFSAYPNSIYEGMNVNQARKVDNEISVLGIAKDELHVKLVFRSAAATGIGEVVVEALDVRNLHPDAQYGIFGTGSKIAHPQVGSIAQGLLNGVLRKRTLLTNQSNLGDATRITVNTTAANFTQNTAYSTIKFVPTADNVISIPQFAILALDQDAMTTA